MLYSSIWLFWTGKGKRFTERRVCPSLLITVVFFLLSVVQNNFQRITVGNVMISLNKDRPIFILVMSPYIQTVYCASVNS